MRELVLESPEGLRLRHELAGAGSRTAAGLLDLGLFLALLLFAALLVMVFAQLDGNTVSGVLGALLLGSGILTLVGYLTLVPVLFGGRTLGKHLLGLRVVDVRGWPANPRQHFLRALLWPLEVFLAIPLPIGIVAMAILPESQRLGDLVAGTVCLRDVQPRRGRADVGEPFARDTWEGLEPRRLGLAPALRERFSGEDVAFLRELFARTSLQSRERRELFLDAWRHYSAVLGPTALLPTGLDPAAAGEAPGTDGGATELDEEGRTPEGAAVRLRELYLFLRG